MKENLKLNLNLKERKKMQKGITLVALVVTIVVLLILAGITIITLTGENGIIKTAQDSKTQSDRASIKEQIERAVINSRLSITSDANMDLAKLDGDLSKIDGLNIESKGEDGNLPWAVTVNGYKFQINENGTVELLGAKPMMTNVKIATDANGNNTATSNTPEGTTLYITFGASLEGGTISKVIDDKSNQEMTANNGVYSKTVTENGKYTFTIKGTVNGEERESKSILVTVKEFENNVKPGTVISLTSTLSTTEEFYVLSYNESTQEAKALAKYNLKVGANYDSSGYKIADIATTVSGYGLQDAEMKGYVSGQQRNGTIAFSSSRYWNDTSKYPNGTSGYPYVYNKEEESCTIKQYVEAYKTKLGNTDKVSEVSLASYEDIDTLWSNKSKYTWLYSTSYWLGSAYGSSSSIVWDVITDGTRNNSYYNYSSDCGVRPVITIDMSKI